MLDEPLKGLAMGSITFVVVLFVSVLVVGLITRFLCKDGQTCYSINFVAILVVMGYIMWACVYMAQMYPLIQPEYAGSE